MDITSKARQTWYHKHQHILIGSNNPTARFGYRPKLWECCNVGDFPYNGCKYMNNLIILSPNWGFVNLGPKHSPPPKRNKQTTTTTTNTNLVSKQMWIATLNSSDLIIWKHIVNHADFACIHSLHVLEYFALLQHIITIKYLMQCYTYHSYEIFPWLGTNAPDQG